MIRARLFTGLLFAVVLASTSGLELRAQTEQKEPEKEADVDPGTTVRIETDEEKVKRFCAQKENKDYDICKKKAE